MTSALQASNFNMVVRFYRRIRACTLLIGRDQESVNSSLVLLGWKSVADQKYWNQRQRSQGHGRQRPVEEPTGCDGEQRQRGGNAHGEDHQPGRHQLSEDRDPVHCWRTAVLAKSETQSETLKVCQQPGGLYPACGRFSRPARCSGT